MEQKPTSQELLSRLEQSMEKQNKYMKLQCIFTGAALLCCGIMLFFALSVLPEMKALSQQSETTLKNLEAITEQLSSADLESMVEDVDALVTTSQSAVEQAAEKMNAIDIDTLNQAIKDLAAVVQPLANFFNLF